MIEEEDILSAFSDDPKAEKLDAFDKSTTTLILQQAGVSKARTRSLEHELGAAYGSEWLNSTEAVGDTYLFITRVFNFNVDDLLLKPRKSPVIVAFTEKYNEVKEGNNNLTMIFKCNGTRMVASTIQPDNALVYLYVAGAECQIYITHFTDYFKREQPLEI